MQTTPPSSLNQWLTFFLLFLCFCSTFFHLFTQVKIIAGLSDYEKRIRSHRKHVIERILTLACPRCSRAFIGFAGCFALKCSEWRQNDPNSCCQFCAYCLEDCGRDAHPHVLDNTCPGNKGLFQSKEVFEDAQRSRREHMLRECVYCFTLFFLYCCSVMVRVCWCAHLLCVCLHFVFVCLQVSGWHWKWERAQRSCCWSRPRAYWSGSWSSNVFVRFKNGGGMQKCKRGYYDRTGSLPGSKVIWSKLKKLKIILYEKQINNTKKK